MGSACAHHAGDLTKCSESGQPKVIPTFSASEKLTGSTWCGGELLRQTPQWCVCACFWKNMSICRAAQKHTVFCREKIKESKLGFPLLPGKAKQNKIQPRKPHGKAFFGEISLLCSLGTRKRFPQHNISLSCGLLSLITFSCHGFHVVFGGQGVWKCLRNTHHLLTVRQSSPVAEVCPVYPQELKKPSQPVQPTAHHETDTQLCLGKSHSEHIPQ